MTKNGIKFLLDTIHFYDYDSDYEPYMPIINDLATKYDYNSVVKNLLTFKTMSNSGEKGNEFNRFSRYMKYCKYEPKRPEIDQMRRERKDIDEFLQAEKWFYESQGKEIPKKQPSEFLKKHLKSLPVEYQTYTEKFLLEKSKELNMSILLICEKKGLIPEWLLWDLEGGL